MVRGEGRAAAERTLLVRSNLATHHRQLNASTYSSIAVLKPAAAGATTLSKSHMAVRATAVGVTSLEWPRAGRFVSWCVVQEPILDRHALLLVWRR